MKIQVYLPKYFINAVCNTSADAQMIRRELVDFSQPSNSLRPHVNNCFILCYARVIA
jgi:hypothetical protein